MFLQQRIDEVQAGLHRQHVVLLQNAGQAQRRMSFRPWNRVSGIIDQPRHVVRLQAEEMPQAVRIEHAAQAAGNRFFGADIDHSGVCQRT